MFQYTDNGITESVILDTRRKTRAGLYPVKVRVTFRRDRLYYATGKYLTPSDWEKLPDTRCRALLEIRQGIQLTFDKVKEVIKELVKNDVFSLESLNIRLGHATGDTVNTALQAKVDALAAKGKVSSSELNKYTLRSLQLFAGQHIRFSDVTPDWLHRFQQHLLGEHKSYTTISIYMRTLQAVINEAKAAGILRPSQHPFGKGRYEIPEPEERPLALTVEEIVKITQADCKSDTIEMCRDLWVFSYLCNGANITDVCKLKYSNIRYGEVCFYRQKTIGRAKKKRLIQAVLTPAMQAIIDKWGNKSWDPEEYIFPILQGDETPVAERRKIKNITKLMNDKMKSLGKVLGIDHISTYTARHSYATVLKRKGIPVAFISENLGHANVDITERYLANIEKGERVRIATLLTEL